MKIYPRLFAKLFCTPILLQPAARSAFERVLLGRMDMPAALPMTPAYPDEPKDPQKPYQKRVDRIYDAIGNTAVVSINGVIDKNISLFDLECYGGCDLNDVDQALDFAGDDSAINRVVLVIDSPGGSVTGVPETAARIADIASRKEVIARVEVMACSAAYYLASQADRIDASPSAVLGSIGVYCAILDATRALEMEGLKVELIKAGKFKAMGAPFRALTDDERAMLQQDVDDIYEEFTQAVVAGRAATGATVTSDTMQGQDFRGQRAIDAGLADELINATLDEYVVALLSGTL